MEVIPPVLHASSRNDIVNKFKNYSHLEKTSLFSINQKSNIELGNPLLTVSDIPRSNNDLAPELLLRANRKYFDTKRKVFIADGQVKAFLDGAILTTDLLKIDTSKNMIYADGNILFRKGSNYFQANNLKYNLEDRTGELKDVYGVLEIKNISQDFSEFPHGSKEDLTNNTFDRKIKEVKIACPPILPPIPISNPYSWSITSWIGKMTDSNFGEALFFDAEFREENLFGIGLQKKIYKNGPLELEIEANVFRHQAPRQKGGKYNQSIPFGHTYSQTFYEGTFGIGARIWVRPWLSFGILEGISYNNSYSNYERTHREKYSHFLNYLSLEMEAKVSKALSLVGRIHHRSGAFGIYSGAKEGSNAYLLGIRYRFGESDKYIQDTITNSPSECRQTKSSIGNEPYRDKSNLSIERKGQLRLKEIQKIDQKISKINKSGKLSIEGRFGVPKFRRDLKEQAKYGAIQVFQLNPKGRKKFVTGSISRWRVQARSVKLLPNGWESDRMVFTNDPYTPAQSRIDAKGVQVNEDATGNLLIKTRRNDLILEDRLSIPIKRRQRIKREEEIENYFVFGYDEKDRDGFFIGRNLKEIKLGNSYFLKLQPQFLIQRANRTETNSYILPYKNFGSSRVPQDTRPFDLLGLDAELFGETFGWGININADISTFDNKRFLNGSRYSSTLEKSFYLQDFGLLDVRLFGAYRYRAWNGSLGRSDIYTAYGGYLETKGKLSFLRNKSDYLVRLGLGKYQAPAYSSQKLLNLYKTTLFASLRSQKSIWTSGKAPLSPQKAYRYSPEAIVPGLNFKNNIRFASSIYEGGSHQGLVSISGGPELTLGTFSKSFLDFTKVSMIGTYRIKSGDSPFQFDRVNDMATLGIGFTQQIIGPLLLKSGLEFNIDPSSDAYGKTINSNLELALQRRSYEFGLYYNPYKGIGGLRFTLNDFGFKGTGIPFVP